MPTPLTLFPDEAETIEGTGAALRAGRTTCATVLERCFTRIEGWEPSVRAWVVIDRDGAAAQARARDAELADGKCRGPLHGIPIGVKDIIDVEGLPTAAGFAPWRDRIAARDAEVVARLRRAGAVILGKTVTTQFAWIDPPVTRNPWDLERTPGGSSSGSAAAVATGMCLGALGTQTGGSIIRPASYCGVAGFKPICGTWPTDGVVRLARQFDHVGPIARTVRDLSSLWEEGVLQKVSRTDSEPRQPITRPLERMVSAAAGRLTEGQTPDRPTLFRLRGFFDRRCEPENLAAIERALELFRSAGAVVVDLPDEVFDFEGMLTGHRVILAAQAAAEHQDRFLRDSGPYAPHIRSLIEEGLATPAPRYIHAVSRCRDNLDRLVAHAASLTPDRSSPTLVTPAAVGPAPDASTTGNPCFNSPWSYLGWPALSIPIGLSATEGLPLALQIIGFPFWYEPFVTALWCEDVVRRAARAGRQ